MTLAYTAYLDVIGEEVSRLAEIVRSNPKGQVTACPGWSVDRLAWHLAGVFRSWATQVAVGDPESFVSTDELPDLGDSAAAMEVEATHLIRLLEDKGPDAASWNWSDEDYTTTWVARRTALESAVHRVDAELADGTQHDIDCELAVDGIDERLEVHLRLALVGDPEANLGGSLCLVCSDNDAAWVVGVEHGRLRWRHGRGPADTALVGRASDLFLYTWNRVQPAKLELTGSQVVADGWRHLPC